MTISGGSSGQDGSAGSAGSASCAAPGTLIGTCTSARYSVAECAEYYTGLDYTVHSIVQACMPLNGSDSSLACGVAGTLGCCVSASKHTRTCYFGAPTLRPGLIAACKQNNDAFCQ